jgi:pectate lyase
MNKRVYIALVMIALVSLACSFSTTNTPQVSTGGNSLYQDDFSNSSSGWLTRNSGGDIMEYAGGGFRMYVSGTYSDLVSNAGASLPANVAIDVDITRTAGSENNDFGVLCRVKDLDNFYFFQISSDGYAVVGKYVNNEMQYLSADAMQKVDGINSGSSTNHMRAICNGSSLSLYANGSLVASATDSTFTSGGDVGLMAGTFDAGGVDILFDNLVGTAP